jgi:RNAse (barnase) inhibitor barstar
VSDRPHVRGAFPWLRSGPLWRFDTSQTAQLSEFLDSAGYARLDLDGSRVRDRATAHAQLAELFAFPDWYGGNWDAFHDCMFGWVSEHDGARVALVWHDLPASARQAPVTTTEVGWALLDAAFTHRWSDAGRPTVWLEVFALGDGPDFDRP